MSDIIDLTPAAVSKIKEIFKEQQVEDARYLRIVAEMSEGGRINYRFGVDDAVQSEDEVVKGDIDMLVDAQSVELIRGSSIDYVDSFARSGFVVSNPNVKGGCACGGGGCGGGAC